VGEDGTECSETSTYKIQKPGNFLEENIQHSGHSKSFKSSISHICFKSLDLSLLVQFTIEFRFHKHIKPDAAGVSCSVHFSTLFK